MRVASYLGEWETYCLDMGSNQLFALWIDNNELPMSHDAMGQLIWLPVIGNTSRIEVAASGAIFTGMTAFNLQPHPFSNPPMNSNTSIIFGWNSTKWNVDRQYVQQMRKEIVFTGVNASSAVYYYNFPAPLMLTFNQSVSMCRRLGGQLPDFTNLTSWQSAYDAHIDSLPGSKVWLPYIKAKETDNGTVTNFYDGKAVNIYWRAGEPSQPETSCVRCRRDGCSDTTCANTAAFLCHIPVAGVGRPLLHLRGLCAETSLDTIYYPQLWPQDVSNGRGRSSPMLVWKGISGSTYIIYNSTAMLWETRRAGLPLKATSAASRKSFLVGTRQWIVELDTDCPSGSSQLLSLSTCTEVQFNCDDGSCIDLQYR
jgi:hypothetical protein